MHLLDTPDPNPGRVPRREVVAPVSLGVNNVAAPRKINSYRQQYSDNQNISFLPAIVSTRTHACTANFCVFFFYRSTGRPRHTSLPLECHGNATNRRLVALSGPALHPATRDLEGVRNASPPEILFLFFSSHLNLNSVSKSTFNTKGHEGITKRRNKGAGTNKRCRDTGIHKNGPAKKSHLGTRLTRQNDV